MKNKFTDNDPPDLKEAARVGRNISLGIKKLKHLNPNLQDLWSRYVEFVDNLSYIANNNPKHDDFNINISESFEIIYKLRRALRLVLDDILSGMGRGLQRIEKSTLGDVNTNLNLYNYEVDNFLNFLQIRLERYGLEIPGEVPAPVKIVVSSEKYEIKHESLHTGHLSKNSIGALRRVTCGILREISVELDRSDNNADRRLNIAINVLIKELQISDSDFEAIALGLSWQIASKSVDAASESIPDILKSQIIESLSAIEDILQQFEEWKAYENFSKHRTIDDNVDDLVRDVGAAIDSIPKQDDFIDPRISEKLLDLKVAASNGLVSAEGVAAPLVGSMSNFIGTVAHVVIDEAPKFIENAPT